MLQILIIGYVSSPIEFGTHTFLALNKFYNANTAPHTFYLGQIGTLHTGVLNPITFKKVNSFWVCVVCSHLDPV